MYDSFYGFRERPFTLLPDPDFLYLVNKHRAALAMLETAVADHAGFCVISGEIGAGKTTLVRELLNRLDATVCVGLVSNTHPSFGELLPWIMAVYDLPCDDTDTAGMHKRFLEFVTEQYAQNRHTLLIIDEAQNLSVSALEALRTLSNVNSEGDAILQIILVGQQQLRDRLQQPELAQFSQRIVFNYHLEALDQETTTRYIRFRIVHAGGQSNLFSADACLAVYRSSGGIPRLINRLCDLSLVYGYAAKSRAITAGLVDRVIADRRGGILRDIPHVRSVTAQVDTGREGATDRPAAACTVSVDRTEAVSAQAVATDKVPAESALHQLVVNAEKPARHARGKRSALWILPVIIVLVGGISWLTGYFQRSDPPRRPVADRAQAARPADGKPAEARKPARVDPAVTPAAAARGAGVL